MTKRTERGTADDELRAVERTGAHDELRPSLFPSEAVILTAELDIVTSEARIELDPETEAARLLAPAELRAWLEVPVPDGEATAAADVPEQVGAVPDPEDRPVRGRKGRVTEPVKRQRRGNSGERFAQTSDPESLPLRSIPLPDSEPPADFPPDPHTAMVEIPVPAQAVGVGKAESPPVLPPAPLGARRPPPPPASAPPPPVPEFNLSSPPGPMPPAPPMESQPSVVLDAEFGTEERTRVYDRQAPAPAQILPRGRLVVVQGENIGKSWYLNRPLTYLGRGNDNDIVLLDLASSRKHLRLDRHAEGFRVQDLQSGNGTQLNGRRITREEIFDGDRLEVGGHILEFTSLGDARVRPRDTGRVTDPNLRVGPVTPAAPGAVPRSWVIVWSVATFLAVFGAMYLTRMVRRQRAVDQQAEVQQGANTHLVVAREAMARRAWAEARVALQTAQASGAALPDLPREIAQLGLEEKAELALRLATVHLEAGQLAQARSALREVPEGSVQVGDAQVLMQRIEVLDQPPPRAPSTAPDTAALGAPEEPAAPATAAPATAARAAPRTVAPAAPRTAAPAAPRTAAPAAPRTAAPAAPRTAAPAAPRTAAPAAPRTAALAAPRTADPAAARAPRTPRTPRTPQGEAPAGGEDPAFEAGNAAYRERRFSEATAAFERAARQTRGDTRKQAQARAKAVQAVAQALAQADAAEAAGRRSDAASALESALSADRALGGQLAGSLRPALARHLVYEALRDFIARKYVESARKNQRALGFDPRLSQAQDLARKLENQARTLLERARDASGDERKQLVDQIDQVAPGSAVAREAAALLRE